MTMTDQASALREAMAMRQTVAPKPRVASAPLPRSLARTIAVASGKGGVGKTAVTTNLAVKLTQMGRRVVVIDADLGTANVDVACNLSPRYNLSHVVSGQVSLEEVMITAPGGFKLVPGASGLAHIADMDANQRQRLIDQVGALETQADIFLIDCGAGVGPNVLGFTLAADVVLVVTSPEPTAITDAYALIKSVLRRCPEADLRLIVNEARNEAEARSVYDRLAGVSRRFLGVAPVYAGGVLLDAAVTQSIRERRPFTLSSPKCPAAVCVKRLAHRLDRHAAEPGRHGLIRRMTGWLAR